MGLRACGAGSALSTDARESISRPATIDNFGSRHSGVSTRGAEGGLIASKLDLALHFFARRELVSEGHCIQSLTVREGAALNQINMQKARGHT
jgi:hypothetical protein